MPRYQTSGLPPVAARNLSAFMPHFNRMAASGAQQYKDGVSGYPGTRGIPVMSPQQASTEDGFTMSFMGTSRSSDAPDVIYPNQYYVRPERNFRPGLLIQMQDPTAPWLTTMIPVPAVSLRQTYQRNAAAIASGIQNGGASTAAMKQPASQLVAWARRLTGNGLASG